MLSNLCVLVVDLYILVIEDVIFSVILFLYCRERR